MNATKEKAIEARMLLLSRSLKDEIDTSDFTEIIDFVEKHGEYGVALEHLAACCEDNKVVLTKEQLEEIIWLLKEMKFDDESIAYYQRNLTAR